MGRRIVLAVLGVVIILVLAFLLGPRVPVDTTIRFDAKVIGDDPQAYLAREEAAVPNIRDGLEKEIIWADPMVHARTPLAIVYIHGFSASKGEVRPLADEVANQLDANLFSFSTPASPVMGRTAPQWHKAASMPGSMTMRRRSPSAAPSETR